MAKPHIQHHSARETRNTLAIVESSEWRCTVCSKLLGVRHGSRLHIRLQRHNYLVSLPVEAICHGCGMSNQT